jgi:CheY-like chemotaxis protein
MAIALLCSLDGLDAELAKTMLWRRDFVRHHAASLAEAQELVRNERPTIVVVDRDLPWAERLITLLRRDGSTPDLAIVVLARGAVRSAESELVDAGADGVLRLPAGVGWDTNFARMVGLPLRRQERLALSLRVDAQIADDLVTATILNLSEYGMLIQSPVPLELGREIDFSFRLAPGATPITGTGRVVHAVSPTQFGIELLVLEADDRERIRALLAAAPPG